MPLNILTPGKVTGDMINYLTFTGIQFSYATWNGASSPAGFSEVQANYLNQGSSPTAGNAEPGITAAPGGERRP